MIIDGQEVHELCSIANCRSHLAYTEDAVELRSESIDLRIRLGRIAVDFYLKSKIETD